jgi:hypothetical protein
LRNTFINSQMGPIPPPSQEEINPKQRAIKWYDEGVKTEEEKKKGLVTNNSCEDLVHKVAEELIPIDTHKDIAKQTGIKCAIKPF